MSERSGQKVIVGTPGEKELLIEIGHIYIFNLDMADVYIYIYIVNTSFILCRGRVDRYKKLYISLYLKDTREIYIHT